MATRPTIIHGERHTYNIGTNMCMYNIRTWTCQTDGQNDAHTHVYIYLYIVICVLVYISTPTQKMSCRRAPEYNAKEYYRRRSRVSARVWYVLTNYCVPSPPTSGRVAVSTLNQEDVCPRATIKWNTIWDKKKSNVHIIQPVYCYWSWLLLTR